VSQRHVVLIVEDNPHAAEVLREMVCSMDFEAVVATTLEEMKQQYVATKPCALLQDIQLPFEAGARPHENAGQASMKFVRTHSNGPGRVVILVVTEHRNDPDFVWKMAKLQADGFVEKSNIKVLPDRLLEALREQGREDHASCRRQATQGSGSGQTEAAAGRAVVARVF